MKISLNFIYMAISFSGFSLGYFFAFLFLFIKYGDRKANIILALLFFILASSLFTNILIFSDLCLILPHLIRLEWIGLYLIPVLIFLYVKALTRKDYMFKAVELIYFLPVLFCIIYLMPFFIKNGNYKINYINSILSGNMFASDMINRGILNAVQLFFVILIFNLISKHQLKIKNNFSNIETIELSWIFYFNIIYVIGICSGFILDILIIFFNVEYSIYYKILPNFASILIPFLGYKGLKQKKIFKLLEKEQVTEYKNVEKGNSKYYFDKLVELIEKDKLYLNHNLTLTSLSAKLAISKEFIIELIYKYKKRNFYDFINSYRVEEAKTHLINTQISINHAGLNSGFRSRYVMNKIFKYHTNLTPEEYRQFNHNIESSSNQFNIGLLVVNFYNYYELGIYSGIKKVLLENGINLFCFAGGIIKSPYYNNIQRNEIYKSINKFNLDGLIGISGTVGNHNSREELKDFYNKMGNIPIVSIGLKLQDKPSITIDNIVGITELLNHLIKEHNYKKIAFVKGICGNNDAEERFSAYINVLKENDIKIDEKLIVQGDFNFDFGKKAVRILLDERKVNPDVLVCANDDMAFGAIEELKKRKIKIPEDIAVTGFDDVPESKKKTKSLTTVKQPLFEIGIQASLLMLSVLKGNDFNDNIELLSKFKPRQTCGCKINSINPILKNRRKKYNNLEIDKEKKKFIKKYLNQFFFNNNIGNVRMKLDKWISNLIDALFDILFLITSNNFFDLFENIIKESLEAGFDINLWYNIISDIFKKINTYHKLTIDSNIINFFQENTKEVINDCIMESHLFPVHKNNERKQQWLLSTQKLISDYTMEKLKDTLKNELPRLGIKSCYIILFDKDEDSNTFSKLVFAYHDYEEKEINNDKLDENEIIPKRYVGKGRIYIIRSLYFLDEQFGYLVIENDFSDITLYEILASYLSKVLKKIIARIDMKNINNESVIIPGITHSVKKYKKSSLSKDRADKYFKELIRIIEKDKVYTNPDLKINYLAERLNISKHNLSFIINKYVGLNFYDFINEYRITEVIKKLAKNTKKISILDIAVKSGFKSKSTFNKFFKKYTNLTPSEYIKTKL